MGRKQASAIPPKLTFYIKSPLLHLFAMNVRFYPSHKNLRKLFRRLRSVFLTVIVYRIPPTAALCKIPFCDTLFIIAKNTKIPLSIALNFFFVKSFLGDFLEKIV